MPRPAASRTRPSTPLRGFWRDRPRGGRRGHARLRRRQPLRGLRRASSCSSGTASRSSASGSTRPRRCAAASCPPRRWCAPRSAAMYRGATRRIAVLPAASHLVRGRLESAFSLPEHRVPVTGEPRVDVLSAGTEQERRRAAATALVAGLLGELPGGARLVLYAPTWRDGEPDPAIPDAAEWRALVDVLERRNAVLVVRSHPLGAGEYRAARRHRPRAGARQRHPRRRHARPARVRRARHRLLLARVRRRARAAAGRLPRARRRGVRAAARVLRRVCGCRGHRLRDDLGRRRRAARRRARRRRRPARSASSGRAR